MKAFLKENNILTNIEIIDRQHSMLFKLINRLRSMLEVGDPEYTEIIQLIAELSAYTNYHFKTEEQFLEEKGYKHLDLHRAKHQSFIEKIESFSLENMLGTPGLANEILDFLETWLLTHIQHLDVAACKQINS